MLFIFAVCSSVAMVAHVCAPVAASEEAILFRNCLWPDGTFDDVGVELDTSIGQEAFEDRRETA